MEGIPRKGDATTLRTFVPAVRHGSFSPSGNSGAYRRVLLVTPQPFFEERGTPIAVAMTVRALVETGYLVDLLAFPVGETISIPGVRIERCGNPFRFRRVPVGFSLRKVMLDASLLQRFEQLLARREYDVVHAVEEAAWLAAGLCPTKKVPFIYDMASSIPEQLTTHRLLGLQPMQALLRGTERRVIERAAHVICSGGLGSRVSALVPQAPLTEWRFPVILVPADPRAITALREQQQITVFDHVVLYMGNFSSYQGIELLLDAFVLAAANDPRLLLVCVGARDVKEAEQFTLRLPAPIRERVRILQRQKRDSMSAWLELADCLVSLRTNGDNIPLKLFEYMAARKPIVATLGPSHQPLLSDARAFLCEASAAAVSVAIGRVFANTDRSRVIADAAADYAAKNFSWPRFRSLVAGVYGRVLSPELPGNARSAERPETGPRARWIPAGPRH